MVFRVGDGGGSPTVSRTTKSSSPPAGTPSMMTLDIAMCAAVKAFSASACSASAALTFSASSLACSSSAGRSSLDAAPTFLLAAFCSARRLSAAETAARRAASAFNSASTRPGSSPRARCDARTASGFSRSSLRSITAQTLPSGAQPHNVTSASLVTAPATPVTMERMLDAPERVELPADEAEHPTPKVAWWRSLHATSTRRALLLTALGGLLIAGVLTALPRGDGPSTVRWRDNPRPARRRDLQQGQERRLPELAGTQPGCGRGRRLQGRAPLRGRGVGRHADLPRQRVRTRRRTAVAVAHSADQPGAVPGRGAPLPGRAVRPQQPVHRQHDVVGRQGVAAVGRAPHAVRPATARRQQLSARVPGQGRRNRPVQGLARRNMSGHRPVHQPADRHPGRLRGPARHGGDRRASTSPRSSPPACRPNPNRTRSSRTRAPG